MIPDLTGRVAHLEADVHDQLAPGQAELLVRLERLERRLLLFEEAVDTSDVDGLRRRVEALEHSRTVL